MSRPKYIPEVGTCKKKITDQWGLTHHIDDPQSCRAKCRNGSAHAHVTAHIEYTTCPACLKMIGQGCSAVAATEAWSEYYEAYEEDTGRSYWQ